MSLDGYFGTAEAARRLRVSRDTLLRWFREGRVSQVGRDGRGWRFFTSNDIARIALEVGLPRIPAVQSRVSSVQEVLQRTPSPKPVRLIQYLGSKLRSLDKIIPEIERNTPANGIVLDLFAGTTVVGQGLNRRYSVLCNDSLPFCKLFGDVLVGGPDSSQDLPLPSLEFLISSSAYKRNTAELSTVYEAALRDEARILDSKDLLSLATLAQELPHTWGLATERREYQPIAAFLAEAQTRTQRNGRLHDPAFLITGYYAGNYFGVRQSIQIDSMRLTIAELRKNGAITDWQSNALLAALMASCSRAVSSAGKHFAQPLILSGNRQRSFGLTRSMADRRVDVASQMELALAQISGRASLPRRPSRSFLVKFEDLIDEAEAASPAAAFTRFFGVDRVDTIYADPPYTAQQYSRFYHLLETLQLYDYPVLQDNRLVPGLPTQGLYRLERHKSIFCGKSTARAAFAALFRIAHETSDCLILSYSVASANSGNPRMISANDILSLASSYTPHIEEITFDHNYRKLNRESVNRQEANPERLYVFRFR